LKFFQGNVGFIRKMGLGKFIINNIKSMRWYRITSNPYPISVETK